MTCDTCTYNATKFQDYCQPPDACGARQEANRQGTAAPIVGKDPDVIAKICVAFAFFVYN